MKSLGIIIILNFLFALSAQANTETLRILTWADFFHPEVLVKFEKKHNVRIEIVPYYTSSMRDFLLKNENSQRVDIVVSGQSGIIDYINLNKILPLQIDKLPNYKNMDLKLIKNKTVKNHSINISYGFMGIGYRNDKKIIPPTSWYDFINPYENVKGKIDLIADPEDAIDIFLIGSGVDLENYDMENLLSASKLLYAFQDNLESYEYNSEEEESNLITGKSWIAPLFGFEAYEMTKNHKEISFVYPEEGVKIWRDYVSVLNNNNEKKSNLSFKFLDHIMESKNGVLNTEHNLYASLNNESNKIVKKELINNEMIYKRKEVKVISDEINNQEITSKKHYLYYRILESYKEGL